MKRLNQIVASTSLLFDYVAAIALVAMVLLATANAVTRKTPLGPIPGTFEIVGYLGAAVIAFAIARTQLKGGNIMVEIVVSRFYRRTQAGILSVVYLVGFVLYAGVSWATVELAAELSRKNEVSPTLHISYYPLVYAVGACFALLAMVLLADYLRALKETRRE